ncbi:MAG TPA: hypothetical protein VMR45_02870 [Patescibacteria group bacterium]|nr:hypothetical protein [Patescibacteria group bacterium]
MVNHEFAHHNKEALRPVNFPNALRNDGQANTYTNGSGEYFLEPLAEHDFEFSRRLNADGLSGATVVGETNETQYLHYDANSDLIPLTALTNVSVRNERGDEDMASALGLVVGLLKSCQRRYGKVPSIDTLDGLAIDRMAGRAELLAPFHVSDEATPEDILEALYSSAVTRLGSENMGAINRWFDRAFIEARQK